MVQKNLTTALFWFRKAGRQGHAPSLYRMALHSGDLAATLSLMERSARKGYGWAFIWLGEHFLSSSEKSLNGERTLFYSNVRSAEDSFKKALQTVRVARDRGSLRVQTQADNQNVVSIAQRGLKKLARFRSVRFRRSEQAKQQQKCLRERGITCAEISRRSMQDFNDAAAMGLP